MPRSWAELLGEEGARPEPEAERAGLFSRLRDSLSKSRQALTAELASAAFDPGDAAAWERLEEALIRADVGVRATAELVRRLEARGQLGDLNAALAEEVAAMLGEPPTLNVGERPTVLLVVGVNGTGKTTTIGKLAERLRQHGHEVVLAFIDARCKTLCPLTAQIMYYAKAQLGASAASQIDLVAVNANPTATSVAAVQTWSINHGMLHQWVFVTGTAQQLESVYHLYNVYVQVSSGGLVEHDPIIFIIDANGNERLYFETLDANDQTDLRSQETGLEYGMRQWLPKTQ